MDKNTGNALVALIAGAVVGAGLGLLLAPDKGSATRKKIKRKIKEGEDLLHEKLEDLMDEVKGKSSGLRHKVDDTINSLMDEGKEKTEETIEYLEKKLAELKAQQSR